MCRVRDGLPLPVIWSAAKPRSILDDRSKPFNVAVTSLEAVSLHAASVVILVNETISVDLRPPSLTHVPSVGSLLDSSSTVVWLDRTRTIFLTGGVSVSRASVPRRGGPALIKRFTGWSRVIDVTYPIS